MQTGQCFINGLKIKLNNTLTFFAIGFFDGMFNRGNGIGLRQHPGNRKKAGLHDGIDTLAHTAFFSNGITVNDIKANFFGDHLLLHFSGQRCPNLFDRFG